MRAVCTYTRIFEGFQHIAVSLNARTNKKITQLAFHELSFENDSLVVDT